MECLCCGVRYPTVICKRSTDLLDFLEALSAFDSVYFHETVEEIEEKLKKGALFGQSFNRRKRNEYASNRGMTPDELTTKNLKAYLEEIKHMKTDKYKREELALKALLEEKKDK